MNNSFLTSLAGAALLSAILGCSGAAPAGDVAATSVNGDAAASGANGDAWRKQATKCRASALMPAPTKERGVREGPVIARLAWGIDEDGSRYEIACFDGPTPLDDDDSAEPLSQPGATVLEKHRSAPQGAR